MTRSNCEQLHKDNKINLTFNSLIINFVYNNKIGLASPRYGLLLQPMAMLVILWHRLGLPGRLCEPKYKPTHAPKSISQLSSPICHSSPNNRCTCIDESSVHATRPAGDLGFAVQFNAETLWHFGSIALLGSDSPQINNRKDNSHWITPFISGERSNVKHAIVGYLRLPQPTLAPMRELHQHRS